MTTETIKT